MEIYNLYSGSWHSNCYVLISRDTHGKAHAAVIDPSTAADEIYALVKQHDAQLDMIILTHGHFDHMLTLDALRDISAAPLYIHEADADALGDGRKNAYTFFFGEDWGVRPPEHTFCDRDILALGDETLEVIHTPGHTKGSVLLLSGEVMFTGDTIFSYGFGRYDLYGGDPIVLRSSLNALKAFDKNIIIYPGHGEPSTLGAALNGISYFL